MYDAIQPSIGQVHPSWVGSSEMNVLVNFVLNLGNPTILIMTLLKKTLLIMTILIILNTGDITFN